MRLPRLPDLLRRRPAAPPAPADPGDGLPSVYLPELPAPEPEPDDTWCAWPDEPDPAVRQAMDDATAAHRAAVAAWKRSEDPWAALHAQGDTPAT
ncbi:hypothetical protein [Kitasatospora sp. NPDC059571]|uniref:hypothetical protein n=1 Tax=Kitasatospora sp. NPDC059571 TaxID=3346871 RepID=UPI0036A2B3BC